MDLGPARGSDRRLQTGVGARRPARARRTRVLPTGHCRLGRSRQAREYVAPLYRRRTLPSLICYIRVRVWPAGSAESREEPDPRRRSCRAKTVYPFERNSSRQASDCLFVFRLSASRSRRRDRQLVRAARSRAIRNHRRLIRGRRRQRHSNTHHQFVRPVPRRRIRNRPEHRQAIERPRCAYRRRFKRANRRLPARHSGLPSGAHSGQLSGISWDDRRRAHRLRDRR